MEQPQHAHRGWKGHDNRRRWKPKVVGPPNAQHGGGGGQLRGQSVTVRWMDGNIQWNWFRVLGLEHGLIHLLPLDQYGNEFGAEDARDAFWTPTQAIDRMGTRHVHDGDLQAWLTQ